MNTIAILAIAITATLFLAFYQESFTASVTQPYHINPFGFPLIPVTWWLPQRRRNMSYDLRGDPFPIRPDLLLSPWYQPSIGPIYTRPI